MDENKTVITFGTFDLLHIGHVNIIKRAKNYGSRLVVGVSSDQLNYNKKSIYPIYNEVDRMEIMRNIKGVDKVFLEESLEMKRQYILDNKADILVMGSDWEGKFDDMGDICKVVYLPRTKDISSTMVKSIIKNI
jgi:glycerol-3-phosphate cytidylyltransferase